MKIIVLISFLVSILSSPIWGETLNINDLVTRNNLYYKKFTDIPFTGEISGKESGKFKKGKKEGEWIYYHKNGQLWTKGNFKDGKRDGPMEVYHENGQLNGKGNYKDGERDGLWEIYNEDGSFQTSYKFKNGIVQND